MSNPGEFNRYFNNLIEESGNKIDWVVTQIKTGKNRELYANFGLPSKSTIRNWRNLSKPTRSLWMFLVACHVWRFSYEETNTLLDLAKLPDLDNLYADATEAYEKELLTLWIEPGSANRTESRLKELEHELKQLIKENEAGGNATQNHFEELTTLPLATIPPIRPLPPGSFIPYSENHHFVGREMELGQLAAALKHDIANGFEQQIVALTGLGGMGKTQLAVEFAHRYGAYFAGGVFWVNCAEREGIQGEIALAGEKMNLAPNFAELDTARRFALVQQAWAEPTPRLLIFDNLDHEGEAILHEFKPKTGGACLLITSRQQRWSPALNITSIPITSLPPDPGQRLLKSLAPRLSDSDAAEVGDFLGYFPLALHVAGSYLSLYDYWEVSEYLDLLRSKALQGLERRLNNLGYSPTDHELSIEKTIMVSWERLDPTDQVDQVAQHLYSHVIWFAPNEPIPIALLQHVLDGDNRLSSLWGLLEPVDQGELLYDAIRRLVNLGLLEKRSLKSISIHPLLLFFGQQLPKAEFGYGVVQQGLLTEAERLDEQRKLGELRPWVAHLLHFVDHLAHHSDQSEEISKRSADLNYALTCYLYDEGLGKKAIPYLNKTIEYRKVALTENHPETVKAINLMALLHILIGEYEQALTLFEECLAMRQKSLGMEHADTINSLFNIGTLYCDIGAFEKGLPFLEECLRLREEILGQNHFDTGMSYNNLGLLYRHLERYDEALSFLEKSHSVFKGLPHSNRFVLGVTISNLGSIHFKRGAYQKAHANLHEALQIYRETAQIDPNHPAIAATLFDLGEVYVEMEQLETALGHFEECYAIRQAIFGEDHPKTSEVMAYIERLKSKI